VCAGGGSVPKRALVISGVPLRVEAWFSWPRARRRSPARRVTFFFAKKKVTKEKRFKPISTSVRASIAALRTSDPSELGRTAASDSSAVHCAVGSAAQAPDQAPACAGQLHAASSAQGTAGETGGAWSGARAVRRLEQCKAEPVRARGGRVSRGRRVERSDLGAAGQHEGPLRALFFASFLFRKKERRSPAGRNPAGSWPSSNLATRSGTRELPFRTSP